MAPLGAYFQPCAPKVDCLQRATLRDVAQDLLPPT